MRVTEAGLATTVIPDGPVAVIASVPLKPLTPVRVTRLVPEEPRGMVRVVGLSTQPKPAAATSRGMLLVWVIPVLKPVAVTVTVNWPAVGALQVTLSAPVVENVRSTEPFASVQVAPVGATLTISLRVSEKAPRAV